MNYTQIKIGSKDVYLECLFVHVAEGSPKPIPAIGYQMSDKIYTVLGQDFYLEYRELEGELILE